MPDVMKTLLLNPPSFEKFDWGASSRWPATREIESYWYPVWLTYPAGMLPGSRLLDASPHKIGWKETVEIARDYEFLVLYTSTVGFESDLKLIREMKAINPDLKIALVGPHGHIKPEETLRSSEDIDLIVREVRLICSAACWARSRLREVSATWQPAAASTHAAS